LGELAIAVLFTVGGLGIMASTTLAVLLGRRASLASRATVIDTFGGSLGGARDVVRRAVQFALAVQVAGASAYLLVLAVTGPAQGIGETLWQSIFYAASAFNNAGFDLVGHERGFTVFASQPLVLLTTAVLIVIGGLGFVIAGDLIGHRRWRPLAVETKLVVIATAVLIVAGAVVLGFVEWSNPRTLGPMGLVDKLVNALFASITPRSAGFASVDMRGMTPQSDTVTTLLMFIGSASGSTGGGIKVNTLAVLILVVLATAGRRSEPEAFGRRIAVDTIARAVSVLVVSAFAVLVGVFVVSATGGFRAGTSLFETVSAFGTVGLSLAGTPRHEDATSLVLAALMFLGRIGPIALVILLFGRDDRPEPIRLPEQTVRVG
jgi:trk system potassium uptake protein TrkH